MEKKMRNMKNIVYEELTESGVVKHQTRVLHTSQGYMSYQHRMCCNAIFFKLTEHKYVKNGHSHLKNWTFSAFQR